MDRRQRAGGLDRPGDDAGSPSSVGLDVAVEAETHDLDGLVAAVAEYAGRGGSMYDYITFLTDFGLQDDFVGVCRGVMKRIARDAEILDVSHGIAPQAVTQGALVLARAIPYLPAGRPPRGRRSGRRQRPPRGRGPHRRAAASSSAPTTAC